MLLFPPPYRCQIQQKMSLTYKTLLVYITWMLFYSWEKGTLYKVVTHPDFFFPASLDPNTTRLNTRCMKPLEKNKTNKKQTSITILPWTVADFCFTPPLVLHTWCCVLVVTVLWCLTSSSQWYRTLLRAPAWLSLLSSLVLRRYFYVYGLPQGFPNIDMQVFPKITHYTDLSCRFCSITVSLAQSWEQAGPGTLVSILMEVSSISRIFPTVL